MTDEVEQDNNDLKGGFGWADMWQTVFFTLECMVMLASLGINLCLLRATARNSSKETSVLYMVIIFFFFTSLVDDGLIIEYFMAIYGHQVHSTDICRFVTFVTIGNRLLQAFGVLALLYFSWALLELKSTRVEQKVRAVLPLIIIGLIVLEVVFTLPPTMNVRGSSHSQYCLYVDDDASTVRLIGWLFYVLFPYFIPLILSVYPVIRILLKLRKHDGVTDRDRGQYQTVLAIVVGYFFFHLLYYLLWLGREFEALALDKTAFRNLLGLHVWYIARPLFALINLGWHIITPLSPFVFDTELLEEFPGPWVNKNKAALHASRRSEDIVLEDRGTDRVDGGGGEGLEGVAAVKVTKEMQWTEIHNPLPSALDDDREYHQIPL